MNSLGTEFKVGLFTLIAAVVIGYMFFLLSPDSFEQASTKSYYTVLRDAAGIIPKTQVKTNGVLVGKVRSVDLETNKTKVWLEVNGDVKVPQGSKVEIRTRGLLGDVFIEIVRSADNGQYVEDGGFIPLSDDAASMQELMSMFGGIAKDVKTITSSLANALGNKEGEQTIVKIVKNVEDLTAAVKEITTENRQDIRAMVENFQKTSDTIRKLVGDQEGEWKSSVGNLHRTIADLKEFSDGLKEVMNAENRTKIDRILASFDQSMNDVQSTTKNIKLIAEKVERGEGTLGRLINDDSTLSEIEGAVKDIREVLKPVSKLEIDVDYHGEFRQDKSSQNYFSVYFRTRPDRYYLVGLTDSADRTVTTTTSRPVVDDDNDPNTTTVEEQVKEEKNIRFNLQFAKRWYFAGVRFGLFESTGGIASDFYLFRDRFRVAFEAFDFQGQNKKIRETAHFKAYMTMLFFDHVYAVAGLDDPTRIDPATGKPRKNLNYFLGAGLTFNDQDLKTLISAAAIGGSVR